MTVIRYDDILTIEATCIDCIYSKYGRRMHGITSFCHQLHKPPYFFFLKTYGLQMEYTIRKHRCASMILLFYKDALQLAEGERARLSRVKSPPLGTSQVAGPRASSSARTSAQGVPGHIRRKGMLYDG